MNLIESETKRIRAAAFYDAAKIVDMAANDLEIAIAEQGDELAAEFARLFLVEIRTIANNIRDAGRAQL